MFHSAGSAFTLHGFLLPGDRPCQVQQGGHAINFKSDFIVGDNSSS